MTDAQSQPSATMPDIHGYYRFYVEQAHKMLGYLQIVSAAILGFVWTAAAKTAEYLDAIAQNGQTAAGEAVKTSLSGGVMGDKDGPVLVILVVAYLAFAIANSAYYVRNQAAARKLWKIIATQNSKSNGSPDLAHKDFEPISVFRAFRGHAVLVGCVTIAVFASSSNLHEYHIKLAGYMSGMGVWLGILALVVALKGAYCLAKNGARESLDGDR